MRDIFLSAFLRTAEEFANGHIEGAINIPYMFKVGSGNCEKCMMIECFIHVCKCMNLYCIHAFGSYTLFNWSPRRTEKITSWELYSNGKKWLKRIVNTTGHMVNVNWVSLQVMITLDSRMYLFEISMWHLILSSTFIELKIKCVP